MRKRSPQKRVVSAAERLVLRHSFFDPRLVESVNTLSRDELYWLVAQEVPEVDLAEIRLFLEGVVLSDIRGRGILQKITPLDNYGWDR